MKRFTFISRILLTFLVVAAPAFAGDYLIGDGDVLSISVWGVENLSSDVVVRPDGKISIPAAGDVEATGLSPRELGEKLEKKLSALVKKPLVTVTVNKVTNNRIYVSGGGVPAEVVQLPGRTSLFKFLCRFGDLTGADLKRAWLMRDGKRVPVAMDALFVDGDLSQDLVLQPEDILFIPPNERNKVYVVGAVKEPKFIIYRPGLKVLDAILEAGGFSDYADRSRVDVLRSNSARLGDKANAIEVNIKDLIDNRRFDLNLALKPGDYVTVKESMF
ncbi:sugar ABC transporter substrate-binding protein [Geothermobacter hydrogeniphilus]|uniref:Sugar ABC transporter substrate-binding protein n=1 Tax=Geothermobacter hydrogeniphilus TaxID=1969733 RepID=A0A2K2H9L6_9BACT|nr:polysaccharide biosynthesis/export family protein [Geothermobacter hydrogeniphilus]PNU19957.1 sugar ABC transporter substrate-binding protein [Geothermobacter hydrogeniphilus]